MNYMLIFHHDFQYVWIVGFWMMTSSFSYKQHKIDFFNERLSEKVAELQRLKWNNGVYLVEQTEEIHVKR